MERLDERVAYLEGRMEDHTALMADIRGDMRGLRSEIRADMTELRSEMHRIDHTIDRHFMWLAGILVGVLTALAGLAIQVARLRAL
jgi:hypothetical protein